METGNVDRAQALDERCLCGNLVARVDGEWIEILCRRCKRTHRIPRLPPEADPERAPGAVPTVRR